MVSLLKGDVYVTIDLDVFDPSIMPSTGTPEPGGLGWYEVLDLMRLVFHKTNVTGFDVVEMCPNPTNKAPDFSRRQTNLQTDKLQIREVIPPQWWGLTVVFVCLQPFENPVFCLLG